MPPGSHWFGGHIAMIRGDFTLNLKRLMVDHANTYGQTGFWIANIPYISVTDWRDARTILRSEYQTRRMPSSEIFLNMFLGPRNIGALQGREWKLHRVFWSRNCRKKLSLT
jgi:hypothetical protein